MGSSGPVKRVSWSRRATRFAWSALAVAVAFGIVAFCGYGLLAGPRPGLTAAVTLSTWKITEVPPSLYLHGLSSGDFVPALGQFLGSLAELSGPVITMLTETWKAEQRTSPPATCRAWTTSTCGPTASTSSSGSPSTSGACSC